MNVLLINGSPRKNGNTSALADLFVKEMSGKGFDVVTEFLFDKNIKGCTNCNRCAENGGTCAVDDDMQPLIGKIKNADMLVIASPIYMWQFTACIKAFIERMHCLKGFTDGKKVAILMTMGDDEFVASFAVGAMMDMCEYYCMKYTASFAVPYASKERIGSRVFTEKLKDFVDRIVQS